jgi:hypothetical protein
LGFAEQGLAGSRLEPEGPARRQALGALPSHSVRLLAADNRTGIEVQLDELPPLPRSDDRVDLVQRVDLNAHTTGDVVDGLGTPFTGTLDELLQILIQMLGWHLEPR